MTLKVGLIGCGGIMRPHIDGWNTVSGQAEIVAVADVSQEAMQRAAEQIGHPVQMYTDFRELLANPEIEAVDIALPHHLHREAIVLAAQAGKHLMTEKPLCLNLDEAADIERAVQGSGITMMAAHNQLFFPSMLQAKQMLMNGDLGKIYMIHSYDCSARRQPLSLNKGAWGQQSSIFGGTWRSDPSKMGGGEYIDTGYHPTYRMLFLAGKRPSEVTAMMGTYRLPLDEEDSASVQLKFDDGVMGHILTSWAFPTPGARPLLFSVMGEAGQLWGEMDKLYYQPVGFQTPAAIEFPGWNYARSFTAEIEHFVDAIANGYEPLHSVKEATDTLRVIMAAYESTDSNRIVRL
jgi:predicted dehydrogenase